MENCQVDGLTSNKTPGLKFNFVSDAFLQNVTLKNTEDCYLLVEGETSKKIRIELDSEEHQKPCIRLGKDVGKKAVVLD
jgi:hypothetical protein